MSSDDVKEMFAKAYPDLPPDKLKGLIEADKMAGELLEMLEAEANVESWGLPDDAKLGEYTDAVWGEYAQGKIDCQEAIEKIRDYGWMRLVE